jgi:hypothetical protein
MSYRRSENLRKPRKPLREQYKAHKKEANADQQDLAAEICPEPFGNAQD